MSLYVVVALDDGETYEYEYGNLKHATEHYDDEKTATLLEYLDGKHYLIKSKGCE